MKQNTKAQQAQGLTIWIEIVVKEIPDIEEEEEETEKGDIIKSVICSCCLLL